MSTPTSPPLILGAGITGLTAARALAPSKPLVLEKSLVLGGLAAQYEHGAYRFDYSGHYFHFQGKEEARTFLNPLLKLKTYRRDCRVFLQDKRVPYPLQLHLSWLRAREREAVCRDLSRTTRKPAPNLLEHLREQFGEALCNLFFYPFMNKYTRYPLERMAVGEDRGSIPVPSREAMLASCQGGRVRGAGYNAEFHYSSRPMAPFFSTLAQDLGPRLHLGEEALEICWKEGRVLTPKGTYPYRNLLSTIPLPHLLQRLRPALPGTESLRLPHTSTLVVNGVLPQRHRRFHWIYLPDPQTPYYRAGYYPARTYTAFYLEQTLGPGEQPPSPAAILASTRECLRKLGMLRGGEDLLLHHPVLIPVSYVLIDHENRTCVPPLLKRLATLGIHSIGRYGRWHYSSMSADILDGLQTAQNLLTSSDRSRS